MTDKGPVPARSSHGAWPWLAGGAAALPLIAILAFLFLRREGGAVGNQAATTDGATPAPVANIVAPTLAEPTIRTRAQAEQLAAAFAAAFGERAARTVGETDYRFRPGSLTWIGDRAILVSPGTNSQDCHACAGTLAVHYLVAEGNGFRVAGEWLEGGGFDDYGRPPDWRFSSELSGRPMLRTESGDGNQGIFCNSVNYYEFSESGPRKIADVQIGYSNASGLGGPDDGAEIEGRIHNIRPNQSFDVVYSGSRTFTERWVKRGGRFVPERGESAMPTC